MARGMWHVPYGTWHVARGMWHVACGMWHVAWWHVACGAGVVTAGKQAGAQRSGATATHLPAVGGRVGFTRLPLAAWGALGDGPGAAGDT
eukprot:1594029-Prymnesium_polylepis.1